MFRAMLVVGGLLWALSASASDLWAQSTLQGIIKRGELRVGMEAGYMPFEMRDKSGRIIGFDVDIARLMARAMGVELKLVNTAWDGIIPSLLTDKFDVIIAGMTITPERNLQVNFTQPYMLIGQSIVLNKRHEKTVSSYRDLNDPKFVISTKLGTTGDIAARRYLSRAQVRTYESESEAVTEVRNGRADAFVYCPTTRCMWPSTATTCSTWMSPSPRRRWPGRSARVTPTFSTGWITSWPRSGGMALTMRSMKSGSSAPNGWKTSTRIASDAV